MNRLFNEAAVQEIRERHARGETMRSLASAYGLSVGTIYNVVHRREKVAVVKEDVAPILAFVASYPVTRFEPAVVAEDCGLPIDFVRSAFESGFVIASGDVVVIVPTRVDISQKETNR